MGTNIFNRAFKVVKNVVKRKPKKENISNRLIPRNRRTPRRADFGDANLKSVGVALKNGFNRSVVKVKVVAVKTKDKLRERLLCTVVVLQATPFKLPSFFAGDYGESFHSLIVECQRAKLLNNPNPNGINSNYTCTTTDVKSHELFVFICDNKHIPRHVAQVFAHLSEDQVRQLSSDWLNVKVEARSLTKMLMGYGSFNAPEHLLYLLLIGFTLLNVTDWLPRIFEDRIRLPVHSYSVNANKNLRAVYEVPILLRKSRLFKKYKIFASDSSKFFNVDLVSFTVVIEFTFDENTKSYIKNSGNLITGFLHNKKYKDDDIDTLLNVGPNNFYWGGSRGVIKNYIKTIRIKRYAQLAWTRTHWFYTFKYSLFTSCSRN